MFSAFQIHLQIMISSVVKPSNGRKRGRPRCKSAPSVISVDKIVPKAKRRMQWTEEAMEAAMSDVRSGKYSVLRAAKLYGIPKVHFMIEYQARLHMAKSLDLSDTLLLLKRMIWLTF